MLEPLLLLVDDAVDVSLIVQHFGRRAGQRVAVQPDAESAWRYLQQPPRPDLVLLDLNLPGASGADLCRRLRDTPALADLSIALFSHWERPRDVILGLDAGVNFVVSKDVLCQAENWNARLAEILPPAPGRPASLSLPWWETISSAPRELLRRTNHALRLATRGPLGPEIVRVLARRAARVAANGVPPEWFDGERIVRALPSETIRAFANACVEQMWSLLGTTGTAPFREVLEAPFTAEGQEEKRDCGDNPSFLLRPAPTPEPPPCT